MVRESNKQSTRQRPLLKEGAESGSGVMIWETFVVPDDIGGRFSVLAWWIASIAASGADIKALWKVRMQP